MLDYSELTIVKNSDGIPTALGYPINSILLQNNKPLFLGGGGGKKKGKGNGNGKGQNKKPKREKRDAQEDEVEDDDDEAGSFTDFEQLAVPAGLVCMTQTVCRNANAYANENSYANVYANSAEQEPEIVPEGLYEQLLALAEAKAPKKLSRP